jgi:hypothetical protein
MRVLIAALLGGIVFFVWGALAHTVLPIGGMGMKVPADQAATLAAIAPSARGQGVFEYPSMPPDKWNDTAAVNAFNDANKGSAYAFVVYQPGGNPAHANMQPNLVRQFVSDFLSAFVVAFVLALGPFGFAKRVFIATSLGAFSWLTVSVPYWNWYMFPMDFTVGNLMEQVIGWFAAGIVMAWWLGRRHR